MKTFFSILFLFFFLGTYAQSDTTYFFNVNGKIATNSHSILKKEIDVQSKKIIEVRTYKYNQDNWQPDYVETVKRIDINTDKIKLKKGGLTLKITREFNLLNDDKLWFSEKVNGVLNREGYCLSKIPLLLNGNVIKYYPDGQKISESVYNNNELISNENWLNNGDKYINNIFYSVDSYPYYELGNQLLNTHILDTFEKKGVSYTDVIGKLIIGFVVLEDGEIDGFRILKGINKELDKSVIEAFKSLSGQWSPAQLNGENVRYFQLFPINFKVENDEVDVIDYATDMASYYRY